jgi:hypothetical protein
VKRKMGVWALLLVCSHLLVFFASRPGKAEAGGGIGSGGVDLSVVGTTAKSRLRAEQDGANAYRRLLGELDASELKGDDYKDARDALMIEWMKKDLRGAMAHFYSPLHFARYRAALGDWERGVSSVLTEEMARQPLLCWDWIFSDSYGSNRGRIISWWIHAMRVNGRLDALLARAAEGEKYMGDALSEECGRMGAEELRQVRELWNQGLYKGIGNDYVARRLELADGDFRALYDQEQDPQLREALLPQWVSQEIGILPMEDALDRLDDVPAELLPEAVRLVASAIRGDDSEAGMDGVVELLEEMDRRDLWRHVPEREVEYIVTQLLSYDASRADPGVLVEQLGTIHREDFREIALREAGKEWGMRSGSEILLKSVETLQPGVDRDRFISGVLKATSDEEVFRALKEEIEDASIKEKAPKEPWSGEGG